MRKKNFHDSYLLSVLQVKYYFNEIIEQSDEEKSIIKFSNQVIYGFKVETEGRNLKKK